MAENPYQRYKEEAVMTMTQGEMLLLLYDEMLKRLRACELLLEQKDYKNFEAQADRVAAIVRYLRDVLDYDYPISSQLYQMYGSFLVDISRIKAARKPERIEELKQFIEELRDAFREAEKKVDA